MGALEKIPIFLITGVLVMIFVCLKHHARSGRLTLWTVAWTLVFTHFLAQLLEPDHGPVSPFLLAVDSGSLQAAVVTFLVSVSSVAEDYAKRTRLLLALGVPSVAYVVCNSYGALRGSFQEGATALVGIGFVLAGVLICRNRGRWSPAILTVAAGFLSWGVAFPIRLLLDRFAAHLTIPGELWDAPKIFVALGMILAVVEDKSESIAGMQNKADRLDRRLERFSAITTRLLGGAALDTICPAIASAITEVSTFSMAVVQLEDPHGRLQVAGSSGVAQDSLRILQTQTQHWTLDYVKSLCSRAQRMGKNSYLLLEEEAILFALPENPNAHWRTGEELLIPLCSEGGAYLGCIRLAAPRDTRTIHMLELSHIERLATDVALAVELQSLHAQLVCSEKLAALGQLLAGVAHELNNPLTAIMGYGELINDAIAAPQARDQLANLVSEARRMNRIIDNLLRFSRHGARDTPVAQLPPVVQQVLALREYYTRTRNVRVELNIAPDLPCLAVSEDEIKQILLNLLNNSSDALEGAREGISGGKQISIRAYRQGSRAVIEVEDTGPGFGNLSRALDPFYTTKPAGKGTGLGLSVCYGIVKKRGGDLEIENVKPHGARVTLKLPVADTPAQPLFVAVARA
jgi:signal transduction histidine kinase